MLTGRPNTVKTALFKIINKSLTVPNKMWMRLFIKLTLTLLCMKEWTVNLKDKGGSPTLPDLRREEPYPARPEETGALPCQTPGL